MTSFLSTVIVDDEPLARKNLSFLLERHPDVNVIATCANGILALQAIEEFRPNLLFLDVQMPTMNGLEVLAAIPEDQMPMVIFATAHDEYAIRAFDVNAVDYLLKPIEDERFEKALQRAREKMKNKTHDPSIQSLLRGLERSVPTQEGAEPLARLMVKVNKCFVYVDVEDIDFLEAAGNYVALHLGTRTHLIRATLTNLEKRLDRQIFIRVSRSQILNIKQAKAFEPHFQGEYIAHLRSGGKVKMNRRFRNHWNHLFSDAFS